MGGSAGGGSGDAVGAVTPLRVAAWQCPPLPGDVAANLARLAEVCERAAAAGADVVVTPELYVTGYAISPELTRRLAEPADGPAAEAVAGITRRSGVAVAYGWPEAGAGGVVYNAATLVDAGAVVGHHRKAHLFGDLDRRRFAPAPELSGVVELRGHRVGLLVCYDVEFPEAVRHLALLGASAVLVPTANMAPYELVSTVLVRARALENGCGVAYANYCGAEPGLAYCGLSTICSPAGEVLALAGGGGTDAGGELLVADLAPPAPTDPTSEPDYLADRRPDLYGDPAGGHP